MRKIFVCPECGSADLLFDALVMGVSLDAEVREVHHNSCICDRCGYDGEPAIADLTPGSSPFSLDTRGHNLRIRNPLNPARTSAAWVRGSSTRALRRIGQLIRERRV